MVTWRYWWKSLTLNHPTTKFGGFRHCVSEGGRFVICHMILLLGTQITSKGHVTCGSASRRTIFLPNLAIDLLRVKTKHILFTHVIWRDYLIEGSCDVMDGRSSVYITTLPTTTLPSVVVKWQDRMTKWQDPLKVSRDFAKLDGYKRCGSFQWFKSKILHVRLPLPLLMKYIACHTNTHEISD